MVASDRLLPLRGRFKERKETAPTYPEQQYSRSRPSRPTSGSAVQYNTNVRMAQRQSPIHRANQRARSKRRGADPSTFPAALATERCRPQSVSRADPLRGFWITVAENSRSAIGRGRGHGTIFGCASGMMPRRRAAPSTACWRCAPDCTNRSRQHKQDSLHRATWKSGIFAPPPQSFAAPAASLALHRRSHLRFRSGRVQEVNETCRVSAVMRLLGRTGIIWSPTERPHGALAFVFDTASSASVTVAG